MIRFILKKKCIIVTASAITKKPKKKFSKMFLLLVGLNNIPKPDSDIIINEEKNIKNVV